MSEKVIMLGNEAIARGAYEAGVKVSAAYPGTPSTEISENPVSYTHLDVYKRQVVDDKDSHEIREGRFCKKCGAPLKYNFYHYSQLGDYACTGCDFKRPAIEYDASDVAVSDHLAFTVDGRRLEANYKGFYNVYNLSLIHI